MDGPVGIWAYIPALTVAAAVVGAGAWKAARPATWRTVVDLSGLGVLALAALLSFAEMWDNVPPSCGWLWVVLISMCGPACHQRAQRHWAVPLSGAVVSLSMIALGVHVGTPVTFLLAMGALAALGVGLTVANVLRQPPRVEDDCEDPPGGSAG